jgi:peptidoglycan-associated lipoprotein
MFSRVVAILGIIALASMLVVTGCGKKPAIEDKPQIPDMPDTTGQVIDEPDIPEDKPVVRLTEDQLRIVYFDFDKYNLRSDARDALEYNARLLKDNLDVTVLIEGHCDERGTVEYNLALGEKRAKSAKDYIKSLGVDADRLNIISYGKERPMALGHDESAWSKNRRAKFTITSQ